MTGVWWVLLDVCLAAVNLSARAGRLARDDRPGARWHGFIAGVALLGATLQVLALLS